jgi:hypothetical protein
VATGSGPRWRSASEPGWGSASGRGRRSAASVPFGYQRRRVGLGWLKGLLALVIALFVIEIGLNPWTFHIGDRFTPLTVWDGYGTVRASNGGRYVLFTRLQGAGLSSACRFTRCQTLRGSAKICTERGSTYTLQLLGSVHAWWTTDGASTSLDLKDVKSGPLPAGSVISFKGSWHGPRLVVADTGSSLTKVFTPRGVVRHTAATPGAGHASVILRYGSSAAFDQACRALAA